jgi:hypothetical protein
MLRTKDDVIVMMLEDAGIRGRHALNIANEIDRIIEAKIIAALTKLGLVAVRDPMD